MFLNSEFENDNQNKSNIHNQDSRLNVLNEPKKEKNIYYENIKAEINSEKKQLIFWICFLLIWTVTFSIITFLFFLGEEAIGPILFNFFFNGLYIVLYLPSAVIGLVLLLYFLTSYYQFSKERQMYFSHENSYPVISDMRVPYFVFSAYKRMIFLQIFSNWIFIFGYFVFAAAISILVIFGDANTVRGETIEFKWGGISVVIDKILDSTKKLVITCILLGVQFAIHLSIFIFAKMKQINLNIVFDIENKIHHEKISSFAKKVHIFCFALIMIPILIALIILFLLSRIIKIRQ